MPVLTIDVTCDHIQRACELACPCPDCILCNPVALALADATGDRWGAGTHYLSRSRDERCFHTPGLAANFLHRFRHGAPVQPFRFLVADTD